MCVSRHCSASFAERGNWALPGSKPPLRLLSPGKGPERAALRCPPSVPRPRGAACQCPGSRRPSGALPRRRPPSARPRGRRLSPHNSPPQVRSRRPGAAGPGAERAARERKGRRRRAVRHLPWPLGGRLGRGAAPGAGSGGRWAHGPGPARPCPRCPEVEMQNSRLSRRDVDFLVVLFFLTLLVPPQRRSERLGGSAARSAGGREPVPGHRGIRWDLGPASRCPAQRNG